MLNHRNNDIFKYQISKRAKGQKKSNNILREENPGYRLRTKGPESLTVAELITIVIREGANGKTAQETSKALLEAYDGNLTKLAGAGIKELTLKAPGISNTKASLLVAVFELAKRISCYSNEDRPVINTPGDAARLVMDEMRYFRTEVFRTMLLDTKNKLIKIVTISSGILDASLTHPREVFAPAILENSSSILLLHNHPSGNVIPSSQDLEITKTLMQAGKIIGIEVLDHILIGNGKFLSMKEKKVI